MNERFKHLDLEGHRPLPFSLHLCLWALMRGYILLALALASRQQSETLLSLFYPDPHQLYLALALGLADEVQSCAGGIQLDTMFVDEGFGSLDEEALEHAISVLNSLTEGNKLVGIISHVGELKQRIDKQIIVTKAPHGGSSIEIVC